jgi:hypothetical protein
MLRGMIYFTYAYYEKDTPFFHFSDLKEKSKKFAIHEEKENCPACGSRGLDRDIGFFLCNPL